MTEHKLLRLVRRHLRQHQAIVDELHALDAAWPALDAAATAAVRSGDYTLADIHACECVPMNALLMYRDAADKAGKRLHRLKLRMRKVLQEASGAT